MKRRLLPTLLCLLLLCSCGNGGDSAAFYCRVVLEEGVGYTCAGYVLTVAPGQDAVFSLRCADGYTVTGADCGSYSLEPSANGGVTLTVREVRYSTVVSLTVERSPVSIRYDINDGSGQPPIELPRPHPICAGTRLPAFLPVRGIHWRVGTPVRMAQAHRLDLAAGWKRRRA